MSIEWASFIAELASNPVLVAVTLLNIGVIVVNGATDAPNAIATVVSTRALRPKVAILMAATCNFLGLLVISFFTAAVAHTIFNLVNFDGNQQQSLIALMAAMVAIIVWGASAWYFGIPTSQSHSLIAGLTGAAIALQGGLGAINMGEWAKVVYGIVLSTLLGFALGWLNSRCISKVCKKMNRRRTASFFRWAQVISGAGVACMHGAQDGQKFMSIFILAISLGMGVGQSDQLVLPIWLMILCALTMGAGTAIGGERIIKSVGVNMVKLEPFQGFAASGATFICLLVSTFAGLPVSTTHTNTTAIMGVGAAKRKSAVKWSIAIDMVKTWVLTFPGCGLLGFAFAHLFLLFT